MKEKIKYFFKDNIKFIIVLIIIIFLFNYRLPYYVNTPGGTIEINNRITCDECNDINGSLNMLYVSEYEATIPLYLLSFIIPNWDLESISTQQVSDEDTESINIRGKVMLENSQDNALYVAYTTAGKTIEITNQSTIVIANTIDNGLEIGDEILEVDNQKINNVKEIKEIINNSEVGDELEILVLRDDKEVKVVSEVKTSDGSKVLGVVIVTNYDYETDPEMDITFKNSESGSSGGLMLALSIYSKISDEDIVKGRKIAGTGTIDIDGNVGEIDGIKYKIMGAAKNNVDIVLVPEENYEEAIQIKNTNDYDMEIVSVKTFNEAVEYLKES